MLSYILKSIICDEFLRVIGREQREKARQGDPMYCMEITFSLHELDHDDPHFPEVRLLIFAEYNTVGVYYQEITSDQECLQPNYGSWEHLSLHDSCWRTDGVARFISRFQDRFATLSWQNGMGNNDWYFKRKISADEAAGLREITREKRGWGCNE